MTSIYFVLIKIKENQKRKKLRLTYFVAVRVDQSVIYAFFPSVGFGTVLQEL